jgi:hypothetical protein
MRRVNWRIALRAGRSGFLTMAWLWDARPYFTAVDGRLSLIVCFVEGYDSLRKTRASYQGATSQLAEKLRLCVEQRFSAAFRAFF